jgi:hypothetical protein
MLPCGQWEEVESQSWRFDDFPQEKGSSKLILTAAAGLLNNPRLKNIFERCKEEHHEPVY